MSGRKTGRRGWGSFGHCEPLGRLKVLLFLFPNLPHVVQMATYLRVINAENLAQLFVILVHGGGSLGRWDSAS